MRFVKYDEASPDELELLSELNVLIRDKHISILNLGYYKPNEVVAIVNDRLPFCFKMHHHIEAWKFYNVRPKPGDPKPEKTLSDFCVYDTAHRDYLYTDAWVEKLAKELIEERKFFEVTGVKPKLN